jgi:hypothetical protein
MDAGSTEAQEDGSSSKPFKSILSMVNYINTRSKSDDYLVSVKENQYNINPNALTLSRTVTLKADGNPELVMR